LLKQIPHRRGKKKKRKKGKCKGRPKEGEEGKNDTATGDLTNFHPPRPVFGGREKKEKGEWG